MRWDANCGSASTHERTACSVGHRVGLATSVTGSDAQRADGSGHATGPTTGALRARHAGSSHSRSSDPNVAALAAFLVACLVAGALVAVAAHTLTGRRQ